MNKKVSLLIVTTVLTIIVFSISTYMQKKLVDYIPTMRCLIVSNDINAYEQITEENIKYVDMPIEIISNVQIVWEINEIKGLYLKDKIYKGQILLSSQFDSKENLMIYNAEEGKEKISIKIKSPDNGVSYTLRENSLVNIYATVRTEYISEKLFSGDVIYIGDENDGFGISKILDSVKILGVFDSNGENLENGFERTIDTILIAVTPQEAKLINLYRDIAVFSITEL